MLDILSKRRAAYKVGMKEQPESIRLIVGSVLDMDNLSGRKTRNRALLIVVGHAAVGYVAAVSLFKKQGVDTVVVRYILRKCVFVSLLRSTTATSGCFVSKPIILL